MPSQICLNEENTAYHQRQGQWLCTDIHAATVNNCWLAVERELGIAPVIKSAQITLARLYGWGKPEGMS